MNALIQSYSVPARFRRSLILWTNRQILWLAKHWLAVINSFLGFYVSPAFLASVLLAYGYINIASPIYARYRRDCPNSPLDLTCVAGEQVAFCHRHVSIDGTLLGWLSI